MSKRDEFLETTKQILSSRVGGRCSFPSCGSPTSGPSNESERSVDSTGMACHIFAAAGGVGAKRYDPYMEPDERRSVKNGIWMCYTHGKQIDNDECRFTSDVLFHWKAIAEKRAQLENELRRSLADGDRVNFKLLGLASQNISVSSVKYEENAIIGEALRSACTELVWGERLTRYLRGYLIERTRNAFSHGKATAVTLSIEPNKVTLIDDGDEFSHHDLLASNQGGGGAQTKRELMQKFGQRIVSVTQRIGRENYHTIALVDEVSDISAVTSCTVNLDYNLSEISGYELQVIKSCSEVYVILPDFFSSSDFFWLCEIMPGVGEDESRLVFVMSDVADYIRDDIEKSYPDSRVIDFGRL